MIKPFVVTIDGPAAAGKGTVAYLLARRYGLLDIDSGAFFRAITWLARKNNLALEWENEAAIVGLVRQHTIELIDQTAVGGRMGVRVDEQDISTDIRTEELSNLVPRISAMMGVRQLVAELQRQLAERVERGVVVEGRDTGTAVFPEAQVKIFLTASAEERAQRRHAEFVEQGKTVPFEEVYSDLLARDLADTERTHSPLTKPLDALVIDSTGRSVEEVVEQIGQVIEQHMPSQSTTLQEGLILRLDTSASELRVELVDREGTVDSLAWTGGAHHAQRVLPLVDELLRRHGVALSVVSAIEVNAGPGSFTGTRVGVAVANALGFALGVPVNGLPLGQGVAPVYDAPPKVTLPQK